MLKEYLLSQPSYTTFRLQLDLTYQSSFSGQNVLQICHRVGLSSWMTLQDAMLFHLLLNFTEVLNLVLNKALFCMKPRAAE